MNRPLNVLLGVSGGIAGYKSIELVRRLRSAGHWVRCSLTRAGASFVAPLSLEVLSGQPLYGEEYLEANGSGEELHISAAEWADVLCIAPATAHVLAKLANGLADDFLTTTALAFDGPRVLAPAMHSKMWAQPAVRRNVEALERTGALLVGPAVGSLASGEVGVGRMAEPEEIVTAIEAIFGGQELAGRTVLVSAGPTREAVDPVRFLSNRSSGKMGFALAAAASARGARTLLVSGPVELDTPRGVERLDVVTAEEMRREIYRLAPEADLIVMAAAVSDFRPRQVARQKIKKRSGWNELQLEVNPDILAGLPALAPGAVIVGFAAETADVGKEARAKLEAKGADLMVANDVSRPEIGFDSDENEVRVLRRGGAEVAFERQSKRRLASRLMDLFVDELKQRESEPVAPDR